MRLNLGAGHAIKDGFINHDIVKHQKEIDVVHDLNILPWPWKDSSVQLILANSVFEHLKLDLIESCNECWRIIKPNGRLHLEYPIFTSNNIHHDPTHRWFLSEKAADYLDPSTTFGSRYSMYTPYKWNIESKKVGKKRVIVDLRPIK